MLCMRAARNTPVTWHVMQGAEDDGAGTTKRDALGGDLMCTLMAALHFPVSPVLIP